MINCQLKDQDYDINIYLIVHKPCLLTKAKIGQLVDQKMIKYSFFYLFFSHIHFIYIFVTFTFSQIILLAHSRLHITQLLKKM